MSVGTTLSHLHKSTAALPADVLEDTTELIYSVRDGALSVCVVVSKLETLAKLIGPVPDLIQSATTKRYGVDLPSIGTDTLRLYTDAPEADVAIYGYYFYPPHELLQKKVYKKVGRGRLAIDRYNGNGVLISADEPESQGDSSFWLGDKDFAARVEQEARTHGYTAIYTRKGEKPQSYLRVAR
jgi:hypothetical protein